MPHQTERMPVEQVVVCPILVGRDAPLSAGFHALDRAHEAHGGALLVSGEAGIGKSRVTRAMLDLGGLRLRAVPPQAIKRKYRYCGRRPGRGEVEGAWCWLRHQPQSELSQWFERRFARGGSRQRRIGIVAVARKLLTALEHYLRTGTPPAGAAVRA